MGHLVGKDIYKKLGKKIDNLTVRVPWNEQLYNILKELYTEQEADLLINMPFTLASLNRLVRITKTDKTKLQNILEVLCTKGLVIDICVRNKFYYMPSPMVVGIFEFTMMRTGGDLNSKKWAKLFHEYLNSEESFYAANFGNGQKISIERALPYNNVINDSEYVEILDYEKSKHIIENSGKIAVGLCSCRHEKMHIGEKECDIPLNKCSTFGMGADYLIRNNLAKEISKSEMLESLEQSKEMGLVLNADNVQKNIGFICHCCKCCCNTLLGISKYGYPGVIVTSNYIISTDDNKCSGCGNCSRDCPVNAISMIPIANPKTQKKASPKVDKSICLGCGVCGLRCKTGSAKLTKRKQRVIHPETTFERVILQCLERGTLQNQMFDEPENMSHKIMRGLVGGFLNIPPVKKALMSDALRSTFLASLKRGINMSSKSWATRM